MHFSAKRSRAEIDLNALRHNYKTVASRLNPGQKIMGVVKANAYGHGDTEVALTLQKEGCELFGVATFQEAERLRQRGIKGEILILGYTPVECARQLVERDISQALLNADYASALAKQGYPVKCHFAVDTGMTRIGLDGTDAEACEKTIRSFAGDSVLRIEGIFTHLSSADMEDGDSKSYTGMQIERFTTLAGRLADLNLPYVHCLNSAGGFRYNGGFGNVVRAGIILYGIEPDDTDPARDDLQPVMAWKSLVSEIHRVGEGVSVSYGRTFVTDKPMTLAVIPTGYADGYDRLLSNRGYVLIRGKRAPIVGRVCMDQMMADITDIPAARVDDEVTLLGTDGEISISASDMARLTDTIGYEVVCGISSRVPRVYIDEFVTKK